MNIIKKITAQLSDYSINHTMLELIKNADSFKKKMFVIPVSVLVLSFWLFTSGALYDYDLDGSFCLIILLGIFLGVTIHSWLSSFKINGWFFKGICSVFKSNTLQSFINSSNYQDKMILDMFEKSTISASILEFYTTLNRINFSYSEPINDLYFSNEEIADNLEKIKSIIYYQDSKAFLKFFKTKFMLNFSHYTQHPHVINLMNNSVSEEGQNVMVEKNTVAPLQEIFQSLEQQTNLKQKFKAAL